MDQHELGALIEKWRHWRGRGVRDLAKAVHVHHTTLSRYLSGARRLPPDRARQLDAELSTGGELLAACADDLTDAADVGATAPGIDSAEPAVPRARVPHQLPAASRHFTGRSAEFARLNTYFATGGGVMVIDGLPGVGKTALTVRWAHQADEAAQFPDGVLFADLAGFTPDAHPAEPASVLEEFLRALGSGADIPATEAGRAGLFRTLTAGRRLLIVLDNAHAADQVRPLLPGHQGCTVLITSRRRMPGLIVLGGAGSLSVAPLASRSASQLLHSIIGEAAENEPDAVDELVGLCGALPLALRIVGERIASHPHFGLAAFARELAESRLEALTTGDDLDQSAAVRTVFDWSYHALTPQVAQTFRRLGLHPGVHVSIPAIAALSEVTTEEAQRRMRILCTAHLVVDHSPSRYRMHDLLRHYAAERVHQDDTGEQRRAAERRVLDHYLGTIDEAMTTLAPFRMHPDVDRAELTVAAQEFRGYQDALAWCAAETPNFAAVIRLAGEHGYLRAWRMAASLWDFFNIRLPWSSWQRCNELALDQATADDDRYGQAWVLTSMGDCLRRCRTYDDARHHFRRALALREALADRPGQGWLWFCLGMTAADQTQHDDAVECFDHGLDVFTELGDTYGQGRCVLHRGRARVEQGNTAAARADLDSALECFVVVDDAHDQAVAWALLGKLHAAQHEHDHAQRYWDAALPVLRQVGDWRGEADILMACAQQQENLGARATARGWWLRAAEVLDAHDVAEEARAIRAKLTDRAEGDP